MMVALVARHRRLARAAAAGQGRDRPGHRPPRRARRSRSSWSRSSPRRSSLWAMTYAQTYLVGWVGQRALADLRLRIFTHLQRCRSASMRAVRPACSISRMTNDVEALDKPRHRQRRHAVPVGADARRDDRDPALPRPEAGAAHLRASSPSWPAPASGSGSPRPARSGARARRSARSPATCRRSLSGIRVVRSFGQEPQHEARFAALNARTATRTWSPCA